ncbi:DNA replication ATP-dependent helicase/nuclease DNA2 [Spathaspora sp. JA1]|nr:DNA replication ATP-dependent helicase/nuclease DNA2 [Spathaspora sp. JA1]
MDPKRPHVTHENNPESIKPIKRPKKTTYFFMPVNRLTSKPTISPTKTTTTTTTKTTKPNEIPQVINPSAFANGTIQPVSEARESNKKSVILPESSDDSYEGIRWRESPKNVRIATPDIDKLPSSPLKNITFTSAQSDQISPLKNMLSKEVLTSTPQAITKTKSELVFKPSVGLLKRSNSLGVEKLLDSKSAKNSLSLWMDKFENKQNSLGLSSPVKESSDDPFSDDDQELLQVIAKMSQKPSTQSGVELDSIPRDSRITTSNATTQDRIDTKKSPEKVLPDDDFSDSFSDDDIIIPKETSIEKQEKVGTTSPDTESDDPFTDDDSELMAILQIKDKLQSPKTTSPLKSHSPVKLHSPLKSGSPSKSQFTKSFQAGIKTIEKNQRSFEDNTDNNISKLIYDRDTLRRYIIVKITPQTYSQDKRQLILEVQDGDLIHSRLIIRGEYCDLYLQVNDIIHIIITNPTNPRLIDDKNNFLIWHPDILLSATTISQQINCPRKTVLLSRYKFPGESNVPLMVGEIVHQIFQDCVVAENWSSEYMNELMDTLVDEYLISIFSIGCEPDDVKAEIAKHLPYVKSWFDKYYKKPLTANNYIDDGNRRERVMFSVEEALDIEENIWSPMFGIKGKVDITITSKLLNNSTSGKFLLPVEIKTGREYITHQAQASLYALLFKDRYDMNIYSYLLVYTKEQLTKKCDINVSDLRSLINLRNRITKYHKDNVTLPPLLQSSMCENCEVQTACMSINHMCENGTAVDSGIEVERYQEIVAGISGNTTYSTFFKYWDNLLAQEEKVMNRTGKQLWTMTSKDREDSGNCLGDLIIVDSDDSTPQQFIYKFIKGGTAGNFHSSQFNPGDRVIISDEIGHFAISTGVVQTMQRDSILIRTRRRIITSDDKLKNFNKVNNQIFKSVLREMTVDQGSDKRFRIDRDNMFYGLGLARYNILNLFLPDGDTKTRSFVVDLKKPEYDNHSVVTPDMKHQFNSDQLDAFNKVFNTKDYSLILGMPGTGKTTVITELIKMLTQQGKTILLASYTNSAVDNILLKVQKLGINLMRIGHVSRVHPKLHDYIVPSNKPITNYQEFVSAYMTPPVVATTCLGINDIAFNLRNKFDYCIVDEASQVSLPVNLGPLRFSDRFILVGDHFQLPPLVQHRDREIIKGLSQSLFKLLAETHPESVCELTYQYRMCRDIMSVSNVLIYNNRLKCGSETVANQSLSIPNPGAVEGYISTGVKEQDKWMNNVMNPSNKVLFLDHDNIPAYETSIGDTFQNTTEAKLIFQIVEMLIHSGVNADQIGVMSFYKAQLRLLKRIINHGEVEILTADQYQGRDKECIIISLVRSNEDNRAGDLVKEWRRLNVAFTRAKSKLIILGSRSTLSSMETTKTFIDFLDSKKWYYKLPSNADMVYTLQARASPRKQTRQSQVSYCGDVILKSNPVLKNVIDDII